MGKKFFLISVVAILVILPLKVEAKKKVCNPPRFDNRLNSLSNWGYGELNRQKWQTLVRKNKKTKARGFDNVKNGLSLYETQKILGFSGQKIKVTCDGKAEYWVWKEKDSKKTIHIIFLDRKINVLKGKGF
ncbi:hypothetical protein IQ255_10895 [Pleurocapsales cyanobacterium LEGE 10410]|nr:hypothetical protein [Pleurocapsales cyanobacterium LEGE 10410]